jgi:hypothetical protein
MVSIFGKTRKKVRRDAMVAMKINRARFVVVSSPERKMKRLFYRTVVGVKSGVAKAFHIVDERFVKMSRHTDIRVQY